MRASFFLLALSTSLFAADWPHWRGPTRSGITGETSGWLDGRWLPPKAAWNANVGKGASSPIIVGEQVFVLGRSGGQEVVRGLSIDDGKELWAVKYRAPEYGRFHVGDESFYSGPSSTPEYDAETKCLYTLGIDGDFHCWVPRRGVGRSGGSISTRSTKSANDRG